MVLEHDRLLVTVLFVVGWRGVECLRVGQRVQKRCEVCRHDVGYEPRDGLWVQHDICGKASGEQKACQDKIDVELEPSIVKYDINPSLLLAVLLSRLQHLICRLQIIDEDVLLRSLPRLRPLQLL